RSSRISERPRPRECSRTTYAATRSSVLEWVKRKENGLRSRLPRLCMKAIVSLVCEAEVNRRQVRRTSLDRRRRRRSRGAGRHLDRAQARRSVGGRPRRESATPDERRASQGRLRVRGLRARGRARCGERSTRGRRQRSRAGRTKREDQAVRARRAAEAVGAVLLRSFVALE